MRLNSYIQGVFVLVQLKLLNTQQLKLIMGLGFEDATFIDSDSYSPSSLTPSTEAYHLVP